MTYAEDQSKFDDLPFANMTLFDKRFACDLGEIGGGEKSLLVEC
jgi:hypothetical protein